MLRLEGYVERNSSINGIDDRRRQSPVDESS
jgi:hypothetical protein